MGAARRLSGHFPAKRGDCWHHNADFAVYRQICYTVRSDFSAVTLFATGEAG